MTSPDAHGWLPIETAPKDGTPIVAVCNHDADPYVLDSGNLTDYGCHCEGLAHVPDGIHVVQWMPEVWEPTDEYGSGYTIPAWWFRYGSDGEEAANPTRWQPLSLPPVSEGGR